MLRRSNRQLNARCKSSTDTQVKMCFFFVIVHSLLLNKNPVLGRKSQKCSGDLAGTSPPAGAKETMQTLCFLLLFSFTKTNEHAGVSEEQLHQLGDSRRDFGKGREIRIKQRSTNGYLTPRVPDKTI
ncbi:hypothetical protein XENOCAPTIV_023035 [Xenoophorus captivus]|uniref:Uncharacterized protein n=1 Tax=Xenoophorus captivus TaxID=1517983 RepID=A0ABV0R2Q1_9TELE